MKFFILPLLMLAFAGAHAQFSVKISVRSNEDKTPLPGASVMLTPQAKTAVSDSLGNAVFDGLPAGSYQLAISHIGFEKLNVALQLAADTSMELLLHPAESHEEEVIVTATRTSRSIDDIPTRIETISGEELAEKSNMKPGDIRMMLNESTGIQTQQTSATSYNSAIRIQGLDGRYTQILRDGFPLNAGFSGGLSLMQIAPLDLRQVEVIKGSASTLYGGGAISGLVNLVSKTPGEERELNFLANATSAKGLDLSAFYSQRFKTLGITVFGSRNTGSAYDPADIGLTAIPEFNRYSIQPKLFFYGTKTTANIGFSYITEHRTGGSINYIKNGTGGYFEKNDTRRFTSQLDVQRSLSEKSKLQLKTSFSGFNRNISIPNYIFEGLQQSSFTELTFHTQAGESFWVAGVNFLSDDFDEEPHNNPVLRNYHHNTLGAFIQNTWNPAGNFSIEAGLRGDYVKQYGFELLPRFSAMFKASPKFTVRLGGGMGYKTPMVFNEDAERVHFQNILPINVSETRNEKSIGANLDFNYATRIGDVGLTVNQLFFYTKIDRPLVLTTVTGRNFFVNEKGFVDTKGIETNLRLSYGDFKYFAGYTLADVNSNFNGTKRPLPLTARHRLNNVLMFEKEDNIKIGLEAYYFSPQLLNDGSKGKSYWISGLMGEKLFEHFSVFINFENLFDTRQTKFDTIFTGTVDAPVFRDIYAPVDGFVINGGIKVKL